MNLPSWFQRFYDTTILPQRKRYIRLNNTRTPYHHHIAVLCNGRKVLAIGKNRSGTRKRGCGFNHRTIHAEIDVIRSIHDIRKLNGATIYILRLAPSGILNSEPCHACRVVLQKCMKQYGLRGYVHT
jgi:hypothetical protein